MKDELCHHGVDGQKWGVQHGPPYPLDRSAARQAAKKRKARQKNMVKINKKRKKSKEASEKRNLSYEKSQGPAKQMTNKELNDTIDRLQREETYRRLVSREKEEKRAAKLAKKAKKEADERLKIQNETTKRQQDLQEEQLKQQKKANGIAHKVIENLLVNAAKTAGMNVTKHLVDNYFKNEIPNVETEPKKKEPYTPLDIHVAKKKESWNPIDVETIDFSKMKFAGGDWPDGPDDLNNQLIVLNPWK